MKPSDLPKQVKGLLVVAMWVASFWVHFGISPADDAVAVQQTQPWPQQLSANKQL
jgi:hypothetical protein